MIVFDQFRPIKLGQRLGSPGTYGTVYRVEGDSNVCIKIFHLEIRNRLPQIVPKLTILKERVGTNSRSAAIPIFLVSEQPNGMPIGFSMQAVDGKEIHQLYGVSDRKVYFSHADFRFLFAVAKNIAIATDILHRHHIVVGDISAKNILVRDDATVCWIDPDSYLIGNPDFKEISSDFSVDWTPPELQENKHLTTPRLPGHDRFGLAVLIFQILMLGRHPFQGRFKANGEAPNIQNNISNRWYAHAGFNAIPLAPPIGTPPVAHLGPQIGDLFMRAFLADTPDRRPHAAEWVDALKAVESNFRQCKRYSGHFFAAAATSCPWCQVLPDYGNLDIFPGRDVSSATTTNAPSSTSALGTEISGFVALLAAPPNIANSVFRPASSPVTPTWSYHPPGWISSLFKSKASELRKILTFQANFERQAASLQTQLTQNLQKQQTYINALAGCARGIGDLQAEASRKLSEASLKLTAKGLLESPIVEQQRAAFLARFRIEPGLIAGFGEKRVTELAGHGIVTAADVSDHRIYRIPGFGASLTAEIVAWKASKEKGFRPTPIALPVHEVERRARELFTHMKPEFLQKREALIKQMTRLTKDAEVCAGEAPVIQKKIDLLVANIRAVDAALKSLR